MPVAILLLSLLDTDQSVRFERFLAGSSLSTPPIFRRGRVRKSLRVGHTLSGAGGGGSSGRGDTEEDLAMAGCGGFVEAVDLLPAAPIQSGHNGNTQGWATRDVGGASGRDTGEGALVHRPSMGDEKRTDARDAQENRPLHGRLRYGCFGGQPFAKGFSGL